MSGDETMPMAKRMEKTAASPVKVKQEPVEQKVEKLRSNRDKLNGTIELSNDKYDPMAKNKDDFIAWMMVKPFLQGSQGQNYV